MQPKQDIKNIVWLASWYPTEIDPLTGDFIMRHAQALSLYQPVHVMHVKKSDGRVRSKIVETTDSQYPNLTQTIQYYSMPRMGGIERAYSYFYSLRLYYKLVKRYINAKGKPHLLHVHVLLRCGLVALYCKWVHKIPYAITEQYAGYMPAAKGSMKGITALNRLPLKLIIKNAAVFLPVSQSLANALQQTFLLPPVNVVYNVVNTNIFNPVENTVKLDPPVFLHISTLSVQKNIDDMLKAFALLKQQYKNSFMLRIVGPHNVYYRLLAVTLGLEDNIEWISETSQSNLASLMHGASAFVLYSHFETFGCVNIEAMACGLPVIASDIPVFKEYLTQGVTAFFAQPSNPDALAATLHNFLQMPQHNNISIALHAQQFNYQTIGKKIIDAYQQFISS